MRATLGGSGAKMRSIASQMFVLITFLIVAATLGQTKDQLAVEAVLDNAIQAAKTGDANRYLASFADDAILAEMVPGQAPVVSKKALRPWIKDFLEKFTFDWSNY